MCCPHNIRERLLKFVSTSLCFGLIFFFEKQDQNTTKPMLIPYGAVVVLKKRQKSMNTNIYGICVCVCVPMDAVAR
jgi:hypothetical protein